MKKYLIILLSVIASLSTRAADPFPEIAFSEEFPWDSQDIKRNDKIEITRYQFKRFFIQDQAPQSRLIEGDFTYRICGKYKIYDNIIYIMELSEPDEYDMYLACCFNPVFNYPQMIIIYQEFAEIEPDDYSAYYLPDKWAFKYNRISNIINVISRQIMECPYYVYSAYSITPAGFEPKIQNQILPIKELYVSDKELDLKRYGYYINEQDSVEVREVRTPWKKPELKIK